jgi:hypothetical protein
MLPQSRGRLRWLVPLAAALAGLAACGNAPTPDARVRALVAEAERAAEARDVRGVMALVSPQFRDSQGADREELARLVRGWFVVHQAVHLVTRIESIEFPYDDYARVGLTVGALGREAAGTGGLDLAADVHDVVLELRLEDDAWRVVRARWSPARRP